MSNLINLYKKDISKKKVFYDESQKAVLLELASLIDKLALINRQRDSLFFFSFFNFLKKETNLGLYIWGDVGRGKTYLVDLFFSSLPFNKKVRLHFHHFMNLIHDKLKNFSGEKDPLKFVAKWVAKEYVVICLDEFFVQDIGDAMTLSKLFYYLFDFRVFFVITSNVVPSKLYEGGLQRQKFLPVIYLFEKFLKIISVDGKIDYRFLNFNVDNIFFNLLSFNNFKKMKNLFLSMSNFNFKRKAYINILNRKIFSYYVSDKIVWFGFDYICGFGRSQLDYIEISNLFKVVFLSGIRAFTSNDDDSARRFISLIDEFYDRKVCVIISFNCDIHSLYRGEVLKFDFKRTVSRLIEMSNKDYLKNFNIYV